MITRRYYLQKIDDHQICPCKQLDLERYKNYKIDDVNLSGRKMCFRERFKKFGDHFSLTKEVIITYSIFIAKRNAELIDHFENLVEDSKSFQVFVTLDSGVM